MDGTRDRSTIRSGKLVEHFDFKNYQSSLVEKFAFQDKKEFTGEIPTIIPNQRVYFKGNKDQALDEDLFRQANKQSVKVMVSVCLTWNGAIKPLFVNECGVKVNAQTFRERIFTSCSTPLYIYQKQISVQDNEQSPSKLVQDFLQEALDSFFIKTKE